MSASFEIRTSGTGKEPGTGIAGHSLQQAKGYGQCCIGFDGAVEMNMKRKTMDNSGSVRSDRPGLKMSKCIRLIGLLLAFWLVFSTQGICKAETEAETGQAIVDNAQFVGAPENIQSAEMTGNSERTVETTPKIAEPPPIKEDVIPQEIEDYTTDRTSSSSLFVIKSPNTDMGRELWRDQVRPLKEKENQGNKSELQQIIDRLRSVKFPGSIDLALENIETEPVEKITEPIEQVPETQPAIEIIPTPNILASKQYPPQKSITKETLEAINKLSDNIEQLSNPLQLAEILFDAGYLEQAAMCYQQALERTTDSIDSNSERAWILFQIGNCYRINDAKKAIETYNKLLTDFPESDWVEVATVHIKLVQWHEKDNPRQLIEQCTSELKVTTE